MWSSYLTEQGTYYLLFNARIIDGAVYAKKVFVVRGGRRSVLIPQYTRGRHVHQGLVVKRYRAGLMERF